MSPNPSAQNVFISEGMNDLAFEPNEDGRAGGEGGLADCAAAKEAAKEMKAAVMKKQGGWTGDRGGEMSGEMGGRQWRRMEEAGVGGRRRKSARSAIGT